MATRLIKEDSDNQIKVTGPLSLLKKVPIPALVEVICNEVSPWQIISEEFSIPPSTTCKQVYLSKFAKQMQLHFYSGQLMHWGNPKNTILLYFMQPLSVRKESLHLPSIPCVCTMPSVLGFT